MQHVEVLYTVNMYISLQLFISHLIFKYSNLVGTLSCSDITWKGLNLILTIDVDFSVFLHRHFDVKCHGI